MRIGIIGAGHLGGTLTRRLTVLGHEVRVANSRSPETLAELAEETGATPVWAAAAAEDADLVVISIQQGRVVELARGIAAARKPGAPVIDTNNYYPGRDGHIAEFDNGVPESVWVSERIGAPVIKAFNAIWWKRLLKAGRRPGDPDRIAVPVAGDEDEAKLLVGRLVDELGFDVVDAGPLAQSWRIHPGTPVYGQHLDSAATEAALAAAPRERPAQFRYDRKRGRPPGAVE